MKEKIKNLVVSPSTEYVIWSQDLENVVKGATLNVEAGCVALYIVNGVLKSINTPGRWVIKNKEECKTNSRLQLVCVNTDKTFNILCGVGNIPYKDEEMNASTVVGAHGECKIRIAQAWSLFGARGKANITAEEIDEYVRLKMCELMTTRLAQVLQNYEYDNIMTQQSTIAADLQTKFSERLNEVGIEVESFAIGGIRFPEEYLSKREEFFAEQRKKKADKERRREEERAQRAEIDNVIALANATQGLNTNANVVPVAPANNTANSDANRAIKYCTQCGTKVSRDAAFCPSCGYKF